jgi:hypothetical protein
MQRTGHRLAGPILVALGAAGLLTGLAGRMCADEAATDTLPKAEFARLARELHLKNQPWASIPWKVSLTEARQLAARQRKPIFLVVNTGNCLGWT